MPVVKVGTKRIKVPPGTDLNELGVQIERDMQRANRVAEVLPRLFNPAQTEDVTEGVNKANLSLADSITNNLSALFEDRLQAEASNIKSQSDKQIQMLTETYDRRHRELMEKLSKAEAAIKNIKVPPPERARSYKRAVPKRDADGFIESIEFE